MPLRVVDLRKRRVAKHTHTRTHSLSLSLTHLTHTHINTHTRTRGSGKSQPVESRFDVLAGLSWHQ